MILSAFKVGKMAFYLILISGIQARYEILFNIIKVKR